MGIPAIVLAAGASRRLGRPKQLLMLDGETLLARSIRVAREAGAEPVIVVLGAAAEAICASVPLGSLVIVLNSEWEEGMASSIRAGLRIVESCAPHAPAVLLMSSDQPRLSSGHLRELMRNFGESSVVVASVYSGARGVPAVFPRSMFPRLLALSGDRGARGILAGLESGIVEVPFAGGEIDIDTPGDLDQIR